MTSGSQRGASNVAPDAEAAGPFSVGTTSRSFTRALPDGTSVTLNTTIWYPAATDQPARQPANTLKVEFDAPPSAGGLRPILIWSHGNNDVPAHSSIFLSHLASHGLVVAGVTHDDQATDAALRRPDDVRAALDSMLALSAGQDPILAHLVDPQRIGVAGMSFGGYTTLKVLEEDSRFSAGLPIVPGTSDPPADPSKVSRPLMFMSGELDARVPLAATEDFYSRIPATAPDRWFLLVHRAGHEFYDDCSTQFVLTGSCADLLSQSALNAIMARWGTAFLLRYVAGDERYTPLLDPASSNSSDYVVVQTKSGSIAQTLPTRRTDSAAELGSATPYACWTIRGRHSRRGYDSVERETSNKQSRSRVFGRVRRPRVRHHPGVDVSGDTAEASRNGAARHVCKCVDRRRRPCGEPGQ